MNSIVSQSPDQKYRLVILSCGIGDHFAFKMALPAIKLAASMRGQRVVIAPSCEGIFDDETDVDVITFEEGRKIEPDITRFNVYLWMTACRWKGTLVQAFEVFYTE